MSVNEKAKALAMRRRFEERTKLFLNAKQRTIGIDKAYLDKQVREKNQHRIHEEEERVEEGGTINEIFFHNMLIPFNSMHRKFLTLYILGTYQEELCNYLKERELLLREEKISRLEDYRATLAEQVQAPKNNAIGKCEPLKFESCGPSSTQIFDGEDNNYDSRKIARQDQVRIRSWCN